MISRSQNQAKRRKTSSTSCKNGINHSIGPVFAQSKRPSKLKENMPFFNCNKSTSSTRLSLKSSELNETIDNNLNFKFSEMSGVSKRQQDFFSNSEPTCKKKQEEKSPISPIAKNHNIILPQRTIVENQHKNPLPRKSVTISIPEKQCIQHNFIKGGKETKG